MEVDACCHGVGGAAAVRVYAGDRQAALRPVEITAQLNKAWVDHIAALAVDIVGEGGQAGADLVGSKPRATRLLHGVDEIAVQLPQPALNPGHALARGP